MLNADTVVVNIEGDTPLFLECARGKLDWVKAFIGNFDPNGECL